MWKSYNLSFSSLCFIPYSLFESGSDAKKKKKKKKRKESYLQNIRIIIPLTVLAVAFMDFLKNKKQASNNYENYGK